MTWDDEPMRTLSLLIKPVSGSCNLRCKYCFYAGVADSREVKNYGVMSMNTLERLVSSAFSEVTEVCSFGFQGGEPTLAGLDFFRAFIQLSEKYNKNDVEVSYSIQTNGMLLNDEWADFLAENKFLVGLSIDAEKAVHDYLRVSADGEGTHDRCLEAARLLENHKVEFNILSVVSKYLAERPDSAWQFYKRQNFRYLQLIPYLDKLGGTYGGTCSNGDHAPDAETYGNFLCRFFDLWYEDWTQGEYTSVRAFDNYIHMIAGRQPEDCSMSGVCRTYALVEADGSVYPCDFYAVDKYFLGNIHESGFGQLLSSVTAQAFISLSRQINPHCSICEYYTICGGGCRRNREPVLDGVLSLNQYCDAYKKFFPHVLARMSSAAYLK